MRDLLYDEPEPLDVEVSSDSERYYDGYSAGYAERLPVTGCPMRTDEWYRRGWAAGAHQRKADALKTPGASHG